jgi:probable lipoprotein NlpC
MCKNLNTGFAKIDRYIIYMKVIFSVMLMFFAYALFSSAPLDGGFVLAPKASASQEEKDRAFLEARSRVINAAAKYENTPYRYGGITSKGLDCSGLIFISFKDALGVNLPRSASGLYSWVEKIPFDEAQPGDLLFFKTDNSGSITHVAIYLGGRRFIHAASIGPKTGVIYSTLDEGSWSRTFAGAGRAFPQTSQGRQPVLGGNDPSGNSDGSGWSGANFLFGAAFAPTWKGILQDGSIIRGVTSQLRFGLNTKFFGPQMLLGLELRPEFDGALGVFNLPLTLSWGLNDKFRIFAGPVLSVGEASPSASRGEGHNSGGTSLLGTVGLTAAPFIIKSSKGEFAPYFETAWQSYSSDSSNSDFSAGLRFSTGIRWTAQFK